MLHALKRFKPLAFVLALALLFFLPGESLRAQEPAGFILLSAGKDGAIGTGDDIYVTGKGQVVKGRIDLAALGLTQAELVPSSEAKGGSAPVFVPASVAVTADRESAPADGKTAVTITARVRGKDGGLAPDGTEVRFSATLGALDAASANTSGGAASVQVVSAVPGEAVVTATAGGVSSSVSVSFKSATVLADDFSADSGLWTYGGSAYRDSANGCLVLTKPSAFQVGYIWLRRSVSAPFTAEFRYRIGGGTGADGMVFMFYKKTDYAPYRAGWLGFTDGKGPVPGYGIELDTCCNSQFNDPAANCIGLIRDNVSNHLQTKALPQIRDNSWHRVKVVVGEASVEVYFDGAKALSWSGTPARDFGGIGFAAGTGAQYDWHVIDDFMLTFFE